jgi:HlyD family secretion protein
MSSTSLAVADDLPALPPKSPLGMARGIAIAGLATVALFIGVFGVWSIFAPLESAAMGPGVIEAESSRKTIQHLEGGIIGEILVKDGDAVHAGQTLIRLDDTKPRTTLLALKGQYWDALAREARLVAERDGKDAIQWPAKLEAQKDDPAVAQVLAGQQRIFTTRRELFDSKRQVIEQRIAQVNEEIAGYRAQEAAAQRRIVLINEEIKGVKELAEKGLERKPRLLQLQRDLAEIEGRRGELAAQIAKAQQTIAESEVQIINQQNDTQNEVANQLRDTQQKIHELAEQMQAASDVLSRIEVKAPQDGVVTDLKVHTRGGVIQAGEPLMDLVPARDKLIVTVQVRPEDINVVREGLTAHVRLIPYKQRRTPQIDGVVTYVSADRLVDKRTNQPYYATKVRLDADELEKLQGEVELYPGMPAEAMIKTGESTVALYALAPILDSFHRAFREK